MSSKLKKVLKHSLSAKTHRSQPAMPGRGKDGAPWDRAGVISLHAQRGTRGQRTQATGLRVTGQRTVAEEEGDTERGRAALTIEAHVMVGEDGWAGALGGTPDHHV